MFKMGRRAGSPAGKPVGVLVSVGDSVTYEKDGVIFKGRGRSVLVRPVLSGDSIESANKTRKMALPSEDEAAYTDGAGRKRPARAGADTVLSAFCRALDGAVAERIARTIESVQTAYESDFRAAHGTLPPDSPIVLLLKDGTVRWPGENDAEAPPSDGALDSL